MSSFVYLVFRFLRSLISVIMPLCSVQPVSCPCFFPFLSVWILYFLSDFASALVYRPYVQLSFSHALCHFLLCHSLVFNLSIQLFPFLLHLTNSCASFFCACQVCVSLPQWLCFLFYFGGRSLPCVMFAFPSSVRLFLSWPCCVLNCFHFPYHPAVYVLSQSPFVPHQNINLLLLATRLEFCNLMFPVSSIFHVLPLISPILAK